ncbi:MAG: tetratricopeptide repeat protein [Bacteroidota bacterium]|nr:tetratricopeptide repeat protein [Bacteroidota bacterium]MDP4231980.1 tetratricopeptide repeat protein [Bacteroidota bacterium]MDP4287234.1 tetratricopeptide repeat protein [Bacteroidota bacterium]
MDSSTELRLFVSSTFTDFLGERDYLAKKVFPALRSLCRERGLEFTEIDLRWGLTAEDSQKGRIIRTCLEEINSCHPFFIGLLGERYGWVPPIEELEKDPELREDQPWLETAIRNGQSVTELEFRHAFLNHSPGRSKPLVYFRPSGATKEDPRLTRLKREVTGHVGRVPTFKSPQELGFLIEQDLTALIETHWPSSKTTSWLDQERAGHSAFAQSRRKAYVPDLALTDRLNVHLRAPQPVLVLTGESGGGKSSLLAYWAEKLRSQDPNLFIIEHYIGVTAASTDPDTLMRRIIEEIRERTHSEDPVPQSSEELKRVFPSWLARVTGERLLILVDAMNQLTEDGQFLSWLPEHMPSNIKWVLSSTKSGALGRLRDRGWPEVAVMPITPDVRRRVLREYLAGYRKKLARSQENRIVSDPKSSSPLFLRTLLEELRLQGMHEELDRQIEHYLASKDIPDLFTRILERLENDYGKEEIHRLLTRLWAAPHGLSESELLAASELDRSTLSLLLHAFDFHFVRLRGRLSFFHDHLRFAIERRYLGSALEKRNAWKILAAFFQTTEASAIKAHSLPWLLSRAESWTELKETLLDVELLPHLTEGSRTYDLLGYWLTLEKLQTSVARPEASTKNSWNIDVVSEYETALERYRATGVEASKLDRSKERKLLYALALFFHNAGWLQGAVRSGTRALDLCPAVAPKSDTYQNDPDALDMSIDIRLELGIAYMDSGDLKQAADSLETAMQLVAANPTRSTGRSSSSLREILVKTQHAFLLRQLGKYDEAESAARIAMDAAARRFGNEHHTTLKAMRYLADAQALQGKRSEAEAMYRSVLKKVEASSGAQSLETAESLNDLGTILRLYQGDYEEAKRLLERAGNIIEARLGAYHPDLCTLLNNLASLHNERGQALKAEPLFLRCLEVGERAYGPQHPKTATILNNYASMLYGQQAFDRAEPYFRRALEIRQTVFGAEHPETVISLNNLANVLRRAGRNLDEAGEYYKEVLRIRIATLGADHIYTGFSYAAYGQLLRITGDLAGALDLLDRAYPIYREHRGLTHRDTIPVATELAEILLELSLIDRAQQIIAESLVPADKASLTEVLRGRIEKLISKERAVTA